MSEEEKREQEEQASSLPTASTSGNSNPCPICLAPIDPLQESYLDRCFHKFCYKCIVDWSKVVAGQYSEPPAFVSCPLCKTKNLSIIYGYDGSLFERHYIQQIHTDSVFFSEAHKYRLRSYYGKQGSLSDAFNVQRFWRSRKYLQPNQWLHSWMKREVQALMHEEDVDLIVHHILGMVDSFLRRDGPRSRRQPELVQKEFKAVAASAARPFIAGRSDRFVEEMELFLASGMNVNAYDEVYMQQVAGESAGPTGESPEGQPSETLNASLDMFIFDENSHETD